MSYLDYLKKVCREDDVPFFTDDEFLFYYEKNKKDVESTAYECLIVKSQNTTLQISGMTTADTSEYFKRLASMHRPNNSGTLRSGR